MVGSVTASFNLPPRRAAPLLLLLLKGDVKKGPAGERHIGWGRLTRRLGEVGRGGAAPLGTHLDLLVANWSFGEIIARCRPRGADSAPKWKPIFLGL